MLKRPLCLSACFFLLGIILAFNDINIVFTALAVLVASTAVFLYKRTLIPLLFVFIAFLFGGIVLSEMAESEKRLPAKLFDGNLHTVNFTITDFSDGESAFAEFSDGKRHKVYLNIDEGSALFPGDVVCAEVSFSKLPEGNASGFYSYLRGRNVRFLGYTEKVRVTGRDEKGIDSFFYNLRRYIGRIGETRFTGDTKALFSAMVLGDKHFMSDILTAKLQHSGLSHVAAVSGMHLSVVLAAISVLLEKAFGKRRRASLIAIGAVVIITILTGAGASVMRAALMCITYLSAKLLHRQSDSFSALSLTVLLMTGANPFILYNAGFILSVSAVLGILLFNKTINRILDRFISGFFCDVLSVTISAQLTTTAVVIFYFGIITPYAVLSNLLSVVFVNLTIIVGMLLVIFSKVPFIASILAFVEDICSRGIIAVCNITQSLPFATIEIREKQIFVLCCLFVAALFIIRKTRLSVLCASAVFSVLLLAVVCFQTVCENRITMHFPSSGTSDMSVVFLPDGESILVDCASSSDADALLAEHRREKYDYVFFTSRYIGKIQKLIADDKVGALVVPETIFDTPDGAKALDSIRQSGVRVITLSDNELFSGRNVYVRFTPLSVSGNDKAVALIGYMDKTFAFLQTYTHSETEEILRLKNPINADFFRLSAKDFHTGEDFNGKILNSRKKLTLNLY